MVSAVFRPALMLFLLAYLGCSAFVYVISLFIDLSNNSFMGIVALMAAALPAGQKFFASNTRLPTTSEKLQFSLYGSIISIIVSALIVVGTALYFGLPLSLDSIGAMVGMPTADVPMILTFALIAGLVLGTGLIYLFFGMGAKTALKQSQRPTAK